LIVILVFKKEVKMISSLLGILFWVLFLAISPWLVRRKVISNYQREKILAKIKSLPVSVGLLWFIGCLLVSTIAYTTFYFIHRGQVENITEADLSQLSIFIYGRFNFRADDLGLVYNLNHWWNIVFLGSWLGLMRYFIVYRYRWCFPGTKFYFSGYFFIATMIFIMSYFTYVAAPFYGLVLCLIVILMYLATIMILIGLGIIEKNERRNYRKVA